MSPSLLQGSFELVETAIFTLMFVHLETRVDVDNLVEVTANSWGSEAFLG